MRKLFKKKKTGINLFYPTFRISHYINEKLYGSANNNIILSYRFAKEMRYFPNIETPKSLNEKILWLTQHYKNPQTTICADKYRVKDYIKEKTGRDYLTVPTLATYNNVNDIKLEELPDKFVLKVNWGWGGNQVFVIKDKQKINFDKIKSQIDDSLQLWNNFYYISYDWGYKDMKPVIYAEKYIEEFDGQLNDYKLYCFNGKVKMTLVVSNRFSRKKTAKTFFDNEWNILPVKRPKTPINKKIQKPKAWSEMIEIAEKLSKDFPLLRVDFYIINDKPYIGELTFHPGSGFESFEPIEWDYKLGDYLELPKANVNIEED